MKTRREGYASSLSALITAPSADMSLPATMKAVQVVAYRQPYELKTVPVPAELGPYDLLVKVAVASYCHTDSMVQAGVFSGDKFPMTAGHEGSGTVVDMGSAVEGFAAGDRVMCGIPVHACGICETCRSGSDANAQYCADFDGNAGVYGWDGLLAEYARVDARWTTKLPSGVSLLAAAPLACAGRTVWRGVHLAMQRSGSPEGFPVQTLLIVGAGGGLGHLGVQFARALGLRVVAVEARDEGMMAAREAGADAVVDARAEEGCVAAVQQATAGGLGADAALVLSDTAGSTALACAATRVHGTVVQLAQPDEVVVPFWELVFRDIHLVGSLLATSAESRAMVDHVATHQTAVQVTALDGLDRVDELLALVHGGSLRGRAAIVVDREQLVA